MSHDFDLLFEQISTLVMHHSPSGQETEIDHYLLALFAKLGVNHWQDRAGNIIVKIPGQNPEAGAIAITAHKDEIGAIVKQVDERTGRVEIRALGGAYPWIYGEGVMDILGDNTTISGILSFGSRHVSHESPQKLLQTEKPVQWHQAWLETKCHSSELLAAGVRPGSRVVVGKHRKKPFRLKNYIASYTLDNKASLVILIELAQRLKNPPQDVYLVASAKEEVGAVGALYFSQNTQLDALVALEICPLAREYAIAAGDRPVLLSQDGYGIYDEGLNQEIITAAAGIHRPLQQAIIQGFGSDASIAMKFGHVCRGACLSFPTENTHGYEIAHLGAIAHCIDILFAYCQHPKSRA
ncbi:M42 family metallopeptidase [Picosynechococcus sp. PCC 11901]|uniref:M42 family metallopeptidase n=2 Tax=Picosynechococcus TaxID=3079908 RepID=UPI0008109EB4|nr:MULTISPECIES: peptidase M42 [unclassified Picosynechococcus]ANV86872.1 peptidase M42 [Picosynechococcus sp. PCC 7117]QCS49667.1 M42 family metallopeptidase [Picosynechococcus sp. PCC 11901]